MHVSLTLIMFLKLVLLKYTACLKKKKMHVEIRHFDLQLIHIFHGIFNELQEYYISFEILFVSSYLLFVNLEICLINH